MEIAALQVAKYMVLRALGVADAPPGQAGVNAVNADDVAISLCALLAVCCAVGGDGHLTLAAASVDAEAPVATAVSSAILDGADDTAATAAELCADLGSPRRLFDEAVRLTQAVTARVDAARCCSALQHTR